MGSIRWRKDAWLLALAAVVALALSWYFQGRAAEHTRDLVDITSAISVQRSSAQAPTAAVQPPAQKAGLDAITAFAQQRAVAVNVIVDRVQWQRLGAVAERVAEADVEFSAIGAYADLMSWTRELQARYPHLALKTLDLRLAAGPGTGSVEAQLSFRLLDIPLPALDAASAPTLDEQR